MLCTNQFRKSHLGLQGRNPMPLCSSSGFLSYQDKKSYVYVWIPQRRLNKSKDATQVIAQNITIYSHHTLNIRFYNNADVLKRQAIFLEKIARCYVCVVSLLLEQLMLQRHTTPLPRCPSLSESSRANQMRVTNWWVRSPQCEQPPLFPFVCAVFDVVYWIMSATQTFGV